MRIFPLFVSVLSVVLFFASPAHAAKTKAKGASDWRPLLNGKDLGGWETYLSVPGSSLEIPGMTRGANGKYSEPLGANRDPLGVFSVSIEDNSPVLRVSGQVSGAITTKESFENFHLRLEFKWGKKPGPTRDSGVFYFAHGSSSFSYGAYPRCVEFQIREGLVGDAHANGIRFSVMGRPLADEKEHSTVIYDPSGEKVVVGVKKLNRVARVGAEEKRVGEWNKLELVCVGGECIQIVNERAVARISQVQRIDGPKPVPLTSGPIALQSSAGEIFFRGIEIRSIKTAPLQWAWEAL